MDGETPSSSVFNMSKVQAGSQAWQSKTDELKSAHSERLKTNPSLGEFSLKKSRSTKPAPTAVRPQSPTAVPKAAPPIGGAVATNVPKSVKPAAARPELPDGFPKRLKELDWDTDRINDYPTPDDHKYDWLEPDEHGGWKPREIEEQPDEDDLQDGADDVSEVDPAVAKTQSQKPKPHESFYGIKDRDDYLEIPEGLRLDVGAEYTDEQLALFNKALLAIKLSGIAQEEMNKSGQSASDEAFKVADDYFDHIDKENEENESVGLSPANNPYEGDIDYLVLTIEKLLHAKGYGEEIDASAPEVEQDDFDVDDDSVPRDLGTHIDIPLDYNVDSGPAEQSPLDMQVMIAIELANKLLQEIKDDDADLDDVDLEFAIEGIIEEYNLDTYGTAYPQDEEGDPFDGDNNKLGETIYRHVDKLLLNAAIEDVNDHFEDSVDVDNTGLVDSDGNQANLIPEPVKVSASKSGTVPHLASSIDATETLCGRPVVSNHAGYAAYAQHKPTCKRCESRHEADLRTANVLAAAVKEDSSINAADPSEELRQFMIKYEGIMFNLEEKANSRRVPFDMMPVGAAGADEAMKASAIMTFMSEIRRGASPNAAAAKTIEEAVGYVNNHNSKRPNDLNWQRSPSWVPKFVEQMKNDLPASYEESRAGQLASTQELSDEQIEKYFQSLAKSDAPLDTAHVSGFKKFFVKDITSDEWESVLQYDNARDQMLQLWQVADAAANRDPESLSIDYVERLLVDQGIAEPIKFPAMEGDIEHLFLHDGQYKDIKDHTGEMFRGYDGKDYILDLPPNHPDLKKNEGLSEVKKAVDNDLAMRSELPNSAFNFWDVLDYDQILEIEGRRSRHDRFHLNAMRYVGELANAIQNFGSRYKKQDLINDFGGDAIMKRRSLLNGKPGQANLHGSFIDLSNADGTLAQMWRSMQFTIKLMNEYDQIENRLQNETPQEIIASVEDLESVLTHWNVHRDGDLQLGENDNTEDQLRELLVADLFNQLDMDNEIQWSYNLQQYHQFFDNQNDEYFKGDDSLRPPRLSPDQIFPDRPASATVKVGHAGKSKNLAAGLDYNGQPIEFRPQHVANEQIKVWQEQAREIGRTQDNGHKLIVSLFDWTGNWSQPWIDAGYKVLRVDSRTDGDFSIERWFYTQMEEWQDSFGYVEGIIAACPCTAFTATSARHRKTKHDREDDYGKEWLEKTFGYWSTMYGNNVKEFTTWLVNQTREIIESVNPRFHAIENPGIASRIGDLTGIHKPLMLFDPYMYGDPYTKSTGLWGSFNTNLPTNPVNPDEGSKIQSKLSGNNPMQKAMRSITPLGFSSSFFLANHVDDQYDREDYSARNIQRFKAERHRTPPFGGATTQSYRNNLRSIIQQTLQI